MNHILVRGQCEAVQRTRKHIYIIMYLYEQQINRMMPMDTCSSRQQLKSESEQMSKEIIIASIVKYSLY